MEGRMTSAEELSAAVARARAALRREGAVFTRGAVYGVERQIELAERALAGERPAFTHSRRYLDKVDAAAFALRFHTMITVWQKPGDMERTYGMADAAEWLEDQDMALWPSERLLTTADALKSRAREVLRHVAPGREPGNVSPEAYMALRNALDALEHSTVPTTAAACADAIRDCLISQVLRSDLEPDSNLFLPGGGMERLRDEITHNEFLGDRFKAIRLIADAISYEEAGKLSLLMEDEVNFTEANRYFSLWSSSEKIFNFVTPLDASTAVVEISLPSCENETTGLGHVQVKDLRVAVSTGGAWALPEGPVQLCNPTPESEAHFACEAVPVEANTPCTLTFSAKIDGKLRDGIHFRICFADSDGSPCGMWETVFNRTSGWTTGAKPPHGAALCAQCDAIVYAVTGDRSYAEKAKLEILYQMNDFCQGAEHWMVTNTRPHGCDAYGAVQAGRILCSIAAAYTLIAKENVFTKAEQRRFTALAEYMVAYCTDQRDRTALSQEELLRGAGNWQTDMEAGAAAISLALIGAGVLDREAQLRARVTVQNAVYFLTSQLESSVNPDGSYPESLRYHMAALSRYTALAQILSNCIGISWYRTTKLPEMFRYYADMVTPDYNVFGGRPSTPTFGDHNLDDGSAFLQFGLHAGEVAEKEPELGQKLLDIWNRAGRPSEGFSNEDVAFTRLLMRTEPIEGQRPGGWEPLRSTSAYPYSGITVFRKGFHTCREQYLAVMASPRPIGHGHFDQGSFIYYKDCTLVIADPGIIGYFDASKDWLVSSSAHACMQFAASDGPLKRAELHLDRLDASAFSRAQGYLDTPRSSHVTDVQVGAEQESITIEIADPEGRGVHTRKLTWFAEPELILIEDRVSDYKGKLRFNLPIACSFSRVDGSRIVSRCSNGITLETIFIAPVWRTQLDWGICRECAPKVDGENKLQFLRAEADGGFRVLLDACRQGEAGTLVSRTDSGILLRKGDWECVI